MLITGAFSRGSAQGCRDAAYLCRDAAYLIDKASSIT